jgi:hypothetical protein
MNFYCLASATCTGVSFSKNLPVLGYLLSNLALKGECLLLLIMHEEAMSSGMVSIFSWG